MELFRRQALEGVHVSIADVTLRDGMQAANVAVTPSERIEVALLLEEAGVDVIQAGFAGRDDVAAATIRQHVAKPRVSLLLLGFDPLAERHLDAAAKADVDVIEILVRSGRQQLAATGLDAAEAIRLSAHLGRLAAGRFAEVWFCPSFATQANPDTLTEMFDAVAETGVRHFNIPDSSGVATPAEIVQLMRHCAGNGRELGIHCHNDFGLGLANTVAGLSAGATYADVTVNGYGERAGNCSLAELGAALHELFDGRTSLNLARLHDVSHSVAQLAGRTVALDAPIVGRDTFSQKLDAHVKLTDRDPTLLEPFDPATVGNQRRLAIGPGSGTFSLARKLQTLGIESPDPRAVEVALPRIIRRVEEEKSVADEQITVMYIDAVRECTVDTSV